MTLGPREFMRSEAMDGLTGPAHPIPNELLDCGCGQLRCPKLVKYATRKFFVALLCWIGFIQAVANAYFGLTSATIARRFQFEPNTLEWLSLGTDGLLSSIIAVPVAYWGDRIHRAAWTGGLVLIQSAGFLLFIILHFTHPSTRVIEETTNVTHLSLYAEDNPELCTPAGLARISIIEDTMCYMTLTIIVLALIVNSIGNAAFFALGISYLDDNTRRRNVALPIAIILGVRIFGLLFGHLLAWGCLRVDAENLMETVESYREQLGAWWLGWVVLAILLAIPGVPMSWLPRRLPSQVIEQAAASIVSERIGRRSPLSESSLSDESRKVGDAGYLSSLYRLWTNKILICNIFASVFCVIAVVNFTHNEDIILESDFYIPRPSGVFLGFGDPLTSRIIALLLRPVIIAAVIIISGTVVIKFRPRVKWLAGYNVIAVIIAATIILSLAFLSCDKAAIAGVNQKRSVSLLRYCNKDCRCSSDANFHPICDSKSSLIFYTPCHAGCTGVDDSEDIRKYTNCNCIREITGLTDITATQGACDSTTCQIGWIVFEVSTIIAYSLISSTAVSTLLIGLRSTYIQDKALAIGLWMSLTAFFTYIPGKLLYWLVAQKTCIHRGATSSLCLLHDSQTLGAYLAYLTSFLLLIAVVFGVLTFFFSQKLKIYRESEIDRYGSYPRPEQRTPLMIEPHPAPQTRPDEPEETRGNSTEETTTATTSDRPVTNDNDQRNEPTSTAEDGQTVKTPRKVNGPLMYGPLGPGNPRITMKDLSEVKLKPISDTDDTEDEDSFVDRRAPISLTSIQYKRLELHSDAETSDSSPEGRRKIMSLRASALQLSGKPDGERTPQSAGNTLAGFSKTNDIEFTRWEKDRKKERPYTGDFNEVGIPIVNYMLTSVSSKSIASALNPPTFLEDPVVSKIGDNNFKLQDISREVSRGLSPTEHASSGFGSCASDLHKTVNESSVATPVLETSETENSSTKSSISTGRRRTKPSYTTAL
ncbi:solute carrier organic anion transporter family member 2B1-like [Diachasmimorpha longicaudata]|uniref:solute carrier organic anion transporter family member 2B1-like n=1 Tax=Diachasmimorpha longicaudata TaxID=58733 RepID=UPI0030B90EB4